MTGPETGQSLWTFLVQWFSRRAPPTSHPTPDEWQQIQEVLNAALDLPSGERPAFVELSFDGSRGLGAEVNSLLAAHSRTGMLDTPPPDLVSPPLPHDHLRPQEGRTIGRYEVLDKLGGGGMGVVYRGRDVRLERIVALKFLAPHLGAD